eukprot:5335074-Amphidinium_carterae.1
MDKALSGKRGSQLSRDVVKAFPLFDQGGGYKLHAYWWVKARAQLSKTTASVLFVFSSSFSFSSTSSWRLLPLPCPLRSQT